MVEILKRETSNNFAKPGAIAKKSLPEDIRIHLIVDRNEAEAERHLNSLDINWFLYIALAILAGASFLTPDPGIFYKKSGGDGSIFCVCHLPFHFV